ncbi:MAG: hypothetical protein A2289_00990 [Deltaproteobacteria bacterium RIFOXYA12_FULL_58_15]|nr:MAG: hypothetical protein A2289_00990 [Deltaproteobacteria bacterium RIFOXYA12_FULL_58_15]OGR14762.1 MAG: hypothetical protein A2341_05225 [Deltaproteobacteria bacterium RIFOXYB12_FULL_58_9]
MDLVDVTTFESRWLVDIDYATERNFTGKVLYPVNRCLLRRAVTDQLLRAQKYLDEHHSEYVFMLKDCYRPMHVQQIMWEAVKGTPQQSYVANPNTRTGSIHNYGAAVDLTLARGGKEVDMGTPYDSFEKLAQPRHEQRFRKEGQLTLEQLTHRLILRDAMVKGGGFSIINNEWWHFDAMPTSQIRKKFEKLDVSLDLPISKTSN